MNSAASRTERTGWSAALGALAAVLALLSLTVGFGAVDLLSPWILHEGTQVSEVGYGTLAGILIPAGLLAQLHAPRRRIAGLQQLAMAALAFLVAGTLAREKPLLIAAAAVGAALAALVAIHPSRGQLLRTHSRPSPALLVLALAACAPGSQYALHMAFNQRDDVPPFDAHLGLHQWAALSAAALATLLSALLASLRTDGFAIPAFSASAAVLVWALTCLVYPQSAGSISPTWAILSIVWAIAFALAALREFVAGSRASPPEVGLPLVNSG
jgi:hypothetical protein